MAMGAVRGRVLYDSRLELHALPTALTLGGIYLSVVVDCAGGSHPLCSLAMEDRLPTMHDCRGQWADAKAATRWAIEHALNSSSNEDVLAFSTPSILRAG